MSRDRIPRPLRYAHPGQDVWLVKYPSIRPVRARIMTATENVAIAVPYDDGGAPDHNRKQYLKFPPPAAVSTAIVYNDEKSARDGWNALVYAEIADATDSYKEHIKILETRLIPEPGEEADDNAD